MPIVNLKGEYKNSEVSFGVQMNLQENMKVDIGFVGLKEIKLGSVTFLKLRPNSIDDKVNN